MVDVIEVPELLTIPPKLYPVVDDFNKYKFFVIEGGRGSAKTQTIARLLLYLAQERVVRIFCGREIQSTIEESVYTVLADIIASYQLAFKVQKNGIRCLTTGSTFKFKGFREQGSVNIKGIEGADIAWIDEAQAITGPTLDTLLPTLRKNNCKYIFTLNRLFRDDAVMDLTTRDDCLHIHIDYFENPMCPPTLLDEAERCRIEDPRKYNHVWLGQPASAGDEYLFDFDKLYESLEIQPHGELFFKQRVMGVDWAAQGNDFCVAAILDRLSAQHWENTEQIKWSQPDTTQTTGRIISLIAQFKPDVIVIDIGNGGYNTYCDLLAAGVKNVYPFNGATTEGIHHMNLNMRADGYDTLKQWFGLGFLKMKHDYRGTLKQLEKIKRKWRVDGKLQIEEKVKMKSEIGFSPDEADAVMMAVYAAAKYLGRAANSSASLGGTNVIRKTGSRRR